jgi:hypothetical protein
VGHPGYQIRPRPANEDEERSRGPREAGCGGAAHISHSQGQARNLSTAIVEVRRAASGTVEASSFFLLCLAAQEEGKREAGGDGEEAAPVAEPGAGGEAGAAQEDRRRHPRPGNIQAGSSTIAR